MSNSKVLREVPLDHYRAFIADIDAAMESDMMPQVPAELLDAQIHVPVLATMLFNPIGPTLQTISIIMPADRSLPDLMVRRDLNPFAEPFQIPIGTVRGPAGADRTASLGNVLDTYLSANGVGPRITSRAFLVSWPTAVMLCPFVAEMSQWVATSMISGAQKSGLQLQHELEMVETYGTRFRHRLEGEMGHAVTEAIRSIKEDDYVSSDHVSPGELDWKQFLRWWNTVTSYEMVDTLLPSFLLAWRQVADNGPMTACVDGDALVRWFTPFAGYYYHGPRPDDPVDENSSREKRFFAKNPDARVYAGDRGIEHLSKHASGPKVGATCTKCKDEPTGFARN